MAEFVQQDRDPSSNTNAAASTAEAPRPISGSNLRTSGVYSTTISSEISHHDGANSTGTPRTRSRSSPGIGPAGETCLLVAGILAA